MKSQIAKSTLSAAIALSIASCGGSGGVAGIGGSGYISSGSVTGFGSVYVNGVKFETDSSSFDIDGSAGTQDDLGIGMIVQVSGTINADGTTGTATAISFDDQIQGPVTALSMPDADGIKRSFTVLGQSVIIDSNSTTFDISTEDGVPANTAFDFDTIANNNNVEISGFLDSTGALIATRVELKDITFDPASIVEVRGTITGLTNTSFTLNGLTVNAASATLDDLPNGLVNDQLVEVKGTYDIASMTINATVVEGEDDTLDDTAEIEIEGIITEYVSDSNFIVNGITIDASAATREPATLVLANDAQVEVDGAIVNGVLIAKKVESRDGEVEIAAKVGAVNAAASTFEVIPVVGQPPITVTVTSSTEMEDDVNETPAFSLNHLVTGNFVKVGGYEDSASSITANEVKVKNAEDVILQGKLQALTNTSIQILGVTFIIDYNGGAGETSFENAIDDPIMQTEFNNDAPVGTLVKIKDKDGVPVPGVADEIEIETP